MDKAEIIEALEARKFFTLRTMFQQVEPPEVAEVIQELEEENRAIAFRLLGRDMASDVFEYLEPDAQEALIRALGRDRVAFILNDMSPDDRTALLEELPAEVTRQVLHMLTPEERRTAVTLLGYPEDSIGRLMTPDYIAVRENWTVTEVLDHIRKHGEDSETLNVIYVVDEKGKLLDDLRIRQLLVADPADLISDLSDGHFISLSAWDDQETAVPVLLEYDRVALPVTDTNGGLLGIVTFDDVMDVAEEEATEDMQMIGGSAALDEPYIEATHFEVVRKRAGWLVLLFLGQLLTIPVIDYFNEGLQQAMVLVLFIPLIIASGGNTGSQAATLIVRSLAVGEVGLKDWWRVMRREITAGIALGTILGLVGFARVWVGHRFAGEFGEHWLLLGIALAASLLGVVLWGTLVGSMLPFVMQRVGADPAASSTPFVATIVDVTGLLIYLAVATFVLQGTLL
jgi:magnesium transporter